MLNFIEYDVQASKVSLTSEWIDILWVKTSNLLP